MPDFATHYLFGERLELPAAAKEYPALYRWGLQGPDLLFYRKVLMGGSPYHQTGNRMHNDSTERLFASMVHHCRESEGPKKTRLEAYLYGFAGHYVLDAAVHPYVFAQQRRLEGETSGISPSALHGQIESDMDADLYGTLHGRLVRTLPVGELYALDGVGQQTVGDCYTHLLFEVYQVLIAPREIAASVRDMLMVEKLVFSGSPVVAGIAGLLDLTKGRGSNQYSSHLKGSQPQWDSLNLDGATWTDPWTGQERRESVLDLMDVAAEQYCRLVSVLERNARGAMLPMPVDRDFSGKSL